jgi:hypothetical protein
MRFGLRQRRLDDLEMDVAVISTRPDFRNRIPVPFAVRL